MASDMGTMSTRFLPRMRSTSRYETREERYVRPLFLGVGAERKQMRGKRGRARQYEAEFFCFHVDVGLYLRDGVVADVGAWYVVFLEPADNVHYGIEGDVELADCTRCNVKDKRGIRFVCGGRCIWCE